MGAVSQPSLAGILGGKNVGTPYLAHVGYSTQIHWIRLTPFGEEFYRENWQQYRELYSEVDAPAPDASSEK